MRGIVSGEREEFKMVEVTDGAQKMLSEYMKEQNLTSPLRIYLASGG